MSDFPDIFLQLLQSLGLLSLLTLVHSLVSRRFEGQGVQPWLLSALFSVGVIAVMSAPFQVIPGFYLDGRGVVLGLAAPFGGTVAAIVTAGVAATYRLVVGGIGAPAGVLGIALAASAGILFRHTIQRRSGALSAKHLGLLGLLVSTYALSILALPEGKGFSLLADLGWIILATTVGGILLIGAFLANDRRRIVQENTWHRQARVDPLTGLSNRRAFDEAALRYFSYAKRHQQPLSVLVVDCDFFKTVNDRYGHDVGDKVLVKLAAILREGVRTNDVVARFGGEEFVILLPGTGPEDAKGVGEKLRRVVEEGSVTEGRSTITFTVSIGVSGHAGTHESMVGLLRTADAALYAAKENGRNRVEVILPEFQTTEPGTVRAESGVVG